MKLSIVTPKGISFDGEVDYIVIDGDNGQLAILQNHIPVSYTHLTLPTKA